MSKKNFVYEILTKLRHTNFKTTFSSAFKSFTVSVRYFEIEIKRHDVCMYNVLALEQLEINISVRVGHIQAISIKSFTKCYFLNFEYII